MLASIYVFPSLCVCVVRYPTTVSNDVVLSKIYIIITENILYSIYSMALYFIYRRKKLLGKTRHTHVDLSSMWSIIVRGHTLSSYTITPMYNILYTTVDSGS